MTDFATIRQQRQDDASIAQRRASNPANSVWVEASAGTGKTKVLSDRVLRLLLNDVNPMRLLCLTYTKAAAVEMSSRISKRLSEWAVISEDKLERSLHKLLGTEIKNVTELQQYKEKARTLFAKLLDTPGGIKIQTIHSFCTDVLKRFPLEAGISPYFEVLEDEEAKNALMQIKTDILLKENHNGNPQLSAAIDYFTTHLKETTFPNMLKKITDNRREMVAVLEKHHGILGLLGNLQAKLKVTDFNTEEDIKKEFMTDLRMRADEIAANIKAWQCGTETTDKPRAQICAAIMAQNFQVEDYEAYKRCFFTTENTTRKSSTLCTKNARLADAELVKRLELEQERLLECETKLKKLRLYHSTKAAFTIVSEIDSRYEAYKHAKSCMDFADLIYTTRELLQNSSARQWVLYKLDGGIDHILLDEAQDTSPEQWDIVAGLCDDFFSGEGKQAQNRTIFVVGDRKQSIFSFQGADPTKFDAMSKQFEQKAKMANKGFERVNLEVSFRSAPAVLEAVNKIFATRAADGVLPDTEKLKHLPVRAGEFGRVEILPIIPAEGRQTTETYENWSPPMERTGKTAIDTLMAQKIATRIRQMVDEKSTSSHPLHYRDFMVLVRTRNNFVPEFIRACEKEGVAISGADKMLLSEEIAVQDLISLGKFLLYPDDSLSLAEVLTSPLFSIDAQLLEDLCYHRAQGEELWDRLKNSTDERCCCIYNDLKTLMNNLDHIRPFELYNFVLSKLDGRRKFIARMGTEVEDTLDEFINMTLSYEQRQIPNLRGFITWFSQSEKVIKRDSDEQETDAVRLLTVHHSKGLQAPIVFLPDTSKTPVDKKEQMFLQDENLAYYPLNADSYDDNCSALREQKHQTEMEEYRRLLYVALTRAEDQLFICAHGAQKADAWYALCRNALAPDSPEQEITTSSVVYETPELVAKEQKSTAFTSFKEFAFASWIDENVTAIENNLSKPYTPSKSFEEEAQQPDSVSPLVSNGMYYRRGTLIHRLLQCLPADSQHNDTIISEYLQKNAADFSPSDCEQIKKEVLNLLNNPEFADIFGEDSHPEVPIVGEVGGKIVSAQLDRLIVLPDKIKIVDFKTNRPPARDVEHTPPQYLNQLAMYAQLLQKIYPQKPVETYILWTNETRLMRVA